MLVPISKILPLKKDRKDRSTKAYYDHETALAQDIRANGIRTPLRVHVEADKYRIVNGQTRLNAALRAGLAEVPVSVMDGPLDPTRLLVEEVAGNNFQQGFDLLALAEIFGELKALNNWTDAELCRNVPAVNPATLSRTMAIFKQLLPELKEKLKVGELGVRKAYAICRKPQAEQMDAFRQTEHMDAKSAEDHLNDDRKPKAKGRKIRVALPGMVLVLSIAELSKVRALWDQVNVALKKLEQTGFPLDNLPGLVKP